jgi:hypothetical protein
MTRIYALMWGQLVLYVGQTRNTLKQRQTEHRSKGNRCYSKYIPDDIDWEIKLLEECEDDIAIMREQYYYDTLKPFYNKKRPGQTQKESQRKHQQTEAGKETQRKYKRKYLQTEAGKETQRKKNKRYRAKKKATESSA